MDTQVLSDAGSMLVSGHVHVLIVQHKRWYGPYTTHLQSSHPQLIPTAMRRLC